MDINYQKVIADFETHYEKEYIHFHKENGKKQKVTELLTLKKAQYLNIEKDLNLFEDVKLLISNVAESCRMKTKELIEDFVTNCLQYIFETDMFFEIEFQELRGRTEAEFYVQSEYKGQKIKTLPQDARGGGVVDVVSIALRVALIEIGVETFQGALVLDEPFKHLSEDNISRAAEFLKQIGRKFDRQILMVTHNRHLHEIADKSFFVDQLNGESNVNLGK